jgi:hypothetical protein
MRLLGKVISSPFLISDDQRRSVADYLILNKKYRTPEVDEYLVILRHLFHELRIHGDPV